MNFDIDSSDILAWARYLDELPEETDAAIARGLNDYGAGVADRVAQRIAAKGDLSWTEVRSMIDVKEATPRRLVWEADWSKFSQPEWTRQFPTRDTKEFEKQTLVNISTIGDQYDCELCEQWAESGPYTMAEIDELVAKHKLFTTEHPEWQAATGPAPGERTNLIHPNCLLPGQIVEGDVIAAMRSRYAGEMVEIVTRVGAKLTVTPNHPVLTSEGVVAAGALCQGMKLIANARDVRVWPRLNANKAPTTVEDVFAAFQVEGSISVAATMDDLHGDARGVDGDIHVVAADGGLLRDLVTESTQALGDRFFMATDVQKFLVAGLGPRELHRERVALAPPAFVRGSDLLRTRCRVHGRPFKTLRLGGVADLDVAAPEELDDGGSGYAEFVGEFLRRSAGEVLLDEVVGIRRFEYAGHVYDLQTMAGWIVAENLGILNCRCFLVPFASQRRLPVTFKEDAGEEVYSVRAMAETVVKEVAGVLKLKVRKR